VTTTFVIEVGNEYFKFYTNGAPVMIGPNTYGISTPYQEADLRDLKYKQINDVVYIVHPDYAWRKLSRIADTNWLLEEVVPMQPPTLDENVTNLAITPDALSGTVNLEASSDLFNAGHVGSYWRIGHLRESAYIEKFLSTSVTSQDLRILGAYAVRTYGVWDGELQLQRIGLDWATSGADYEVVRKWTSRSDRNIDAEGTSDVDSLYRLVFTANSAGADNRVVLEAVEAVIYAVVKITAVTDSTHAECETLTDFESLASTTRWQEAAFSDYRGHARSIELHQQRLMLGGTKFQPQTVYGSVIGDFENHERGTNDDAAVVFTLGGVQANAIQWMVSQNDLLIGTLAAEWKVSSSSTVKALTPSTIEAKRQSEYGSEYVAAEVVDGVVLYVQRKGRKIRELVYSYETDKFVSADLTLLAEHISEGGIVQLAVQQEPLPILWAVTAAGALIALTYARDQQVVGWHRHPTDGLVQSVTTIFGEDNADDEVWIIVTRTVDGDDVDFVERIDPTLWTQKEDAYFVDCGITWTGAAATTIPGLDHLEGRLVDALANGTVYQGLLVTGGEITLPVAATKVHAGLPFVSQIQPMRIDSDGTLGVYAGKVRRIAELVLRVRKTLGILWENEHKIYDVEVAGPVDQNLAATPLQTKDRKINFHGDLTYDSQLILRQEKPLPFILQAIIAKYDVTGR
jgi:hypothetical protein